MTVEPPATGPVPQGPPQTGTPPPGGGSLPSESPPTGHPSPPTADPEVVPPFAAEDFESEDELIAAAEAALDGDLAALVSERDSLRDLAQRVQADFENYKKQALRRQSEVIERAAEDLVAKLLPVLDTADLAVTHDGSEGLLQLATALYDVLQKEGLERIDPAGMPFDPTEHDAVMHEPGDGDPEVIEVLRAGYRWRGRVLRAAMVKVKG